MCDHKALKSIIGKERYEKLHWKNFGSYVEHDNIVLLFTGISILHPTTAYERRSDRKQ